MLDNMNLVHMNGRVYDPKLGRMLSADPINSQPLNLQRYNRYSYVLNNPLRFIDPTGFDDCGDNSSYKGGAVAGKGCDDEEEPAELDRVVFRGAFCGCRLRSGLLAGLGGSASAGTAYGEPDDGLVRDALRDEMERNREHLEAVDYIAARIGPTTIESADISGFGEPPGTFAFVNADPLRVGSPFADERGPTSHFGTRRDPLNPEQTQFHSGADYAAPEGTSFYAPYPGTIVFADFLPRGGNTIVLQGSGAHSDFRSTFHHLSGYAVSTNEIVAPGQLLGYIGSTGLRTTGPHLHWSLRNVRLGCLVNPVTPLEGC